MLVLVYANSLLASLNMRGYIRRISVFRMSSGGGTGNPTVSDIQTDTNIRSKVHDRGSIVVICTELTARKVTNDLPTNREDLAADGILSTINTLKTEADSQ